MYNRCAIFQDIIQSPQWGFEEASSSSLFLWWLWINVLLIRMLSLACQLKYQDPKYPSSILDYNVHHWSRWYQSFKRFFQFTSVHNKAEYKGKCSVHMVSFWWLIKAFNVFHCAQVTEFLLWLLQSTSLGWIIWKIYDQFATRPLRFQRRSSFFLPVDCQLM